MNRMLALAAAMAVTAAAHAARVEMPLHLAAPAQAHTDSVVRILLAVPEALATAPVQIAVDGQPPIAGQLLTPGLLLRTAAAEMTVPTGSTVRELAFVLPSPPAGAAKGLVAILDSDLPTAAVGFRWVEVEPDYSDLLWGDHPALRYVRTPLDPARRFDTMKVFHHVYDPEDGTLLLTNGLGAKLFPHHRGIMYGFNKTTYLKADGTPVAVDTWHFPKGSQQHKATLLAEGGPVAGRHLVEIGWYGPDNDLFANELREVTVYRVGQRWEIDWASLLTPTVSEVKLDGDPQHAGLHFRANPQVADVTAKQTYYVRPDGVGKLDETRNWDANHTDYKNYPWLAMCFLLNDRRYTVAYLDSPLNPKEARYSERDYGRFGSYFEAALTPDKPLLTRYRMVVGRGEMAPEEVEALSQDFVMPAGSQ